MLVAACPSVLKCKLHRDRDLVSLPVVSPSTQPAWHVARVQEHSVNEFYKGKAMSER